MMRKILFSLLLVLQWMLLSQTARAQDKDSVGVAPLDEAVLMEIELRMQTYIDGISSLLIAAKVAPDDSIMVLEKAYQRAEASWTTYYQAEQMDIATDDHLLDLVGQYQSVSQELKEEIARLRAQSDGRKSFVKTELFVRQQLPVFKKLYKQAMVLTVSAKLAPKLDKLKTQSQMLFADVQKRYDTAKAAAEADPSLAFNMSKLDEQYIEIKNRADKIQAAVYKPFIQRIKDKLLIAAAMAILLMFVTMVTSKLQAIKKARDLAKEYREKYQMNNDNYPTI